MNRELYAVLGAVSSYTPLSERPLTLLSRGPLQLLRPPISQHLTMPELTPLRRLKS